MIRNSDNENTGINSNALASYRVDNKEKEEVYQKT
jgi:hypothetical protein